MSSTTSLLITFNQLKRSYKAEKRTLELITATYDERDKIVKELEKQEKNKTLGPDQATELRLLKQKHLKNDQQIAKQSALVKEKELELKDLQSHLQSAK